MKVVAAYLLSVLGGNANPSANDLKSILASVGAEADDEKIDLLISQVEGKDITELIASGRERLATVASGGCVAVAAIPSGNNDVVVEAKKEEKVEVQEDSEDEYCMNLFD